ncbi:cell death protein CED-3 [Aphelenchoides avenae]|nr:cell death protein CED-3 [Aphelenchus avenae]
MADTVVAYATTRTCVSWRNATHGSWFIQALCKIFAEHAESESMEVLLMMVDRYMAEHSENLAGEDYMQVPSYEFRLRNKFYLTERGLVLLINNNEFANLPSRVGSDVDEYNVRALFEGFGYEVLPTLQDLTADQILVAAKEFARDERHKHCHDCIVVVLTYGDHDVFVGIDGNSVKVNNFVAAFDGDSAPLLVGKPKVNQLTSQLVDVAARQPISGSAQEQIAEIMSKLHAQSSSRVAEAVRLLTHLYPTLGYLAQSKIPYRPGKVYKNFTDPKGLALIINNYKFCKGRPREGTNVDERSIRELLTGFGYDVLETRNDLKAKEMLTAAEEFVKDERHNNCHSCIVVVLTHGDRGTLTGTDCKPLKIEKFVGAFHGDKAPLLAGMPKLFFFQACRGGNVDPGVQIAERDLWSPRWVEGLRSTVRRVFRPRPQPSLRQQVQSTAKKLPVTSDILIAYATPLDYLSWRNTTNGSWFIQSICKIFREHASAESLQSMLTMVHDEVAKNPNFTANTEKVEGCVQMPSYETRLRKQFYFFPRVHL